MIEGLGITEIGIVGIIFTTLFAVPVAGLVLIAYFFARSIRRRNELKAEIYSKALEKGVALPPNVFGGEKKSKNPQQAFNAGVICLAIGLGIALTFALTGWIIGQKEAFVAAAFGLIPMLTGLACFVIYRYSQKAAA
ncbi:MAG: DUF6249 domain-containing protein [Prevotellaceae bacterium]|jgi:hypothetical protein|nr:DUF6249 domain-containing protein [Prevotellaceae bacterium]